MKAASLAVVLYSALLLPCSLSAQKGASAGPTEDQVFDANRQAPLALLQKLYKEKRVVAFGEPDHEHEATRRWVLALLDKIGRDPRLKYVALEWPAIPSQVAALERLSVDSVDEADVPKVLGKVGSAACSIPGIAHTLATLVPKIRAINTRRPAGKKLLIVPIDGMKEAGGGAEETVRETFTSKHFQEAVWSRLGPSEKALVLYHQWHIAKRIPPGFSIKGANWLQKFLTSDPKAEAQMAIVAVDYRKKPWGDDSVDVAEHRLAQRQSTRYPGQSWGVRLAPFQRVPSVTMERGAEMFIPQTTSYRNAESTNVVNTTLPEVEDAIIWDVNPVAMKKPSDYLPVACKSTR